MIGTRAALDFAPLLELPALIVAWTVIVPLGFLAGLGGFDYWVYWISGRPTRPEDHSGHGARTWKDYFRVNTDHKVIGIQYVVTTIFFFVAAGLMAMFMRAELARPGMQFVDTTHVQRALLGARVADDLPLHHPGLRGARELRHPADDRRAGHGVPAPERALVLAAADRRPDHALELPRAEAARSPPAGRTTSRWR